MRIEFNDESFIDLLVNKRGTVGIPYDCEIHAILKSKTASGESFFWIDGADLKAFLGQLALLDQSLKGQAVLKDELAREFVFEIVPVNQSGHYAVIIEIVKFFYLETKECHSTAANAFEVDAQAMSDICKKLIAYFESELKP